MSHEERSAWMDLNTLRGRILVAVITLAVLLGEAACSEPPQTPATPQEAISTPVPPQTESSAGNAAALQSTRQRILTAPEPTSTALPASTPKPATGLRRLELDARYRPVDVHGVEYAAIGPDDQLYIINVETGQRIQVTDDGHLKYEAALSASHAAWVDHRRKIELHDGDSNPPFNYSADIFVLDRATGEEKRITEAPARRMGLEISGDWLVWMDRRNETGEHYVNFDIYAYNLRTSEEIPVVVAPGSQRSPAIHGNTVVWSDNRNSPALATAEAGGAATARKAGSISTVWT